MRYVIRPRNSLECSVDLLADFTGSKGEQSALLFQWFNLHARMTESLQCKTPVATPGFVPRTKSSHATACGQNMESSTTATQFKETGDARLQPNDDNYGDNLPSTTPDLPGPSCSEVQPASAPSAQVRRCRWPRYPSPFRPRQTSPPPFPCRLSLSSSCCCWGDCYHRRRH